MKKIVSVLLALMLMVSCCAAMGETLELGITEQEYLDPQFGNFEAVANDGSIRLKFYVYNTWTPVYEDLEHAGEAVTAMWTFGQDVGFQTLICQFYTSADLGGVNTPEDMLAFLTGMEFIGDTVTVNGIPAVLYHTEFKEMMGGFYQVEGGWVNITVSNITSEDLENEAMLMLCSAVDAE